MPVDKPILERKVFPQDSYIFREGDNASCAYLIQKGRVEIVKDAGMPGEKVLGIMEAGGLFGEMALLDDKPRMASARAIEPLTVVIASRMLFNKKMKDADPFLRGMINVLTDHIRRMANELENN